MASHDAATGRVDFVVLEALRDRSSRYTMSFASKSSMSVTNPQKGCGISLYVRNSLKLVSKTTMHGQSYAGVLTSLPPDRTGVQLKYPVRGAVGASQT